MLARLCVTRGCTSKLYCSSGRKREREREMFVVNLIPEPSLWQYLSPSHHLEVYDDGKQRWIDVVAKQYGKNNRGISNRVMKRVVI